MNIYKDKIMKIKNIYVIILALLVIASVVIILTQKDIFSTQDVIYKDATYLNIREVDVKPVEITSSFVDLNIIAYINHRGGKTNNASMLVRAIDSSAGLLNSQASASIPDTNREDTEKTLIIYQNLKVDRNKDYNLNILLFDNGSILDSGSVSVRGINILTPKSKKSFIAVNNIDFFIESLKENKVSIRPEMYIENAGSDKSDNLKLIVKAREADSNILADKTNIETGSIDSEKTIIKEVRLNIPDKYNYMVVVELWKDDTLVNTWEKPILLAPTKTLPKESQEKKINIEVSKFIREGSQIPVPTVTPPTYAPVPAYTEAPKEPGFEILLGIFALLLMIIRMKRRS